MQQESHTVSVTCSVTLNIVLSSQPNQIVGISYKVFFCFACLLMAGAFGYVGVGIINSLKSTITGATKLQQEEKKTRIKKFLGATVICTVELLAQAINLLLSAWFIKTATTTLILILCLEIPPIIILIVLFKPNSPFTELTRFTTSATRSMTTLSGSQY